jgi:hypothetical protein
MMFRRALTLALVAAGVSVAAAQQPIIEPFGPEIIDTGWTVLSPSNWRGTGQGVTVERSPIRSVSVPLLTGNYFDDAGDVTLWLTTSEGRVLATARQRLKAGSAGWVRFTLPSKGVDVPPGTELTLWVANREREMFGWRYTANKTKQGRAIMIGRADPRFDFLYRLEN